MMKRINPRILSATVAIIMMVAMVGYALAGSLGRVTVSSTPPGAQVVVGGQVIGTTPATLKLPAGKPVRIQIKKSGYKAKSVTLTPKDSKTTKVSVRLKPR